MVNICKRNLFTRHSIPVTKLHSERLCVSVTVVRRTFILCPHQPHSLYGHHVRILLDKGEKELSKSRKMSSLRTIYQRFDAFPFLMAHRSPFLMAFGYIPPEKEK